MSAVPVPGTAGTGRAAVHVVLDPGVPAYGRKGCSVHVQEVLRRLVARADGAPVHLVAARLGGDAPAGLEGVVVHELGRPRADGPAAAERALTALDERAADLVADLVADLHDLPGTTGVPVVYQRYGLWSARTLERARAAGATTVLEVNAPLVDEQARHRVLVDDAGAVALSRRALRSAHAAVAVSDAVATWARELSGAPVTVVPNGVDADRFAPATGSGAVPGAPLTVGFVGTFRPWHGLELLVDAAAALVGTPDAVRLLLVGDGPTREQVLARAAAPGVDVVAPGAVDPAEVPALLAGCDVAAAPYPAGEAYFSPLKLVEYLAAGLPVVASAVADVPRLLHDEREVLLVPPGDVAAMAGALRRLVRDPALRRRLADAGRAAATSRFTWDDVVARTLAGADAARAAADAVAPGPGRAAAPLVGSRA
ncbi:glycosyltransferase family 4 protein [Pseudokineococcus lusitanus]|uniref:Glycosyltransferase involved in cell wall biosynthesis n=1 Tax=Pseudokineococcus lusitanus TaxID=763993 RepID=A0A3N1G8L3_9ACTN|nr:glycosyltransferase family 4 protein [Pseudokineococcus lusitanus]ROP26589.1 glycosyltransferase involved in cell wall biosynthesis [Pseudokineococcus lusitanus]